MARVSALAGADAGLAAGLAAALAPVPAAVPEGFAAMEAEGLAAAGAEVAALPAEGAPADTLADPGPDPTLLAGADEPPQATSTQAGARRHASRCFTLKS